MKTLNATFLTVLILFHSTMSLKLGSPPIALDSFIQKTSVTKSSQDPSTYEGHIVQIISTDKNKCWKFDIPNSQPIVWDCNSMEEFYWKVIKNSDDTYSFKSLVGDYSLDNLGQKANGNRIIVSPTNSENANQKFNIKYYGSNPSAYMLTTSTNFCMDNSGSAANGTKMTQWTCQATNINQSFRFQLVHLDTRPKFTTSPFYIITNTGMCLKYNGAGTTPSLTQCRKLDKCLWIATRNQDLSYTITSKAGGFAFDNASGKNAGNPFFTSQANGNINQSLTITNFDATVEKFRIIFNSASKCVDTKGSYGEGILAQQWNCDIGNTNQAFVFQEPPNFSIYTNVWVQIKSANSGRCVKFEAPLARPILWECNVFDEFFWKLIPNEDGTYSIISKLQNHAIDNKSGRDSANPIFTNLANGSEGQKWTISQFGGSSSQFKIISAPTARCWDNAGSNANGYQMYQWECGATNTNQAFILFPFDVVLNSVPSAWVMLTSTNKDLNKCLKYDLKTSNLINENCNTNDVYSQLESLLWKFVKNSDDGSYSIYSKVGYGTSNAVLDNLNNMNTGANIFVKAFTGAQSQRWTVLQFEAEFGKFRIINNASGKGLDSKGSNERNVILYQWTVDRWNGNQAWLIGGAGYNSQVQTLIKIRGVIKSATSNQIISSSALKSADANIVYTIRGNPTKYNATIQDGGIYEVSLPKGNYERNVTMKEFMDYSTSVTLSESSDEKNLANQILLSPVISGKNPWRIVLTWGASPKDLDSHLVLPNGSEVYYPADRKKSPDGNITLDTDNSGGFGPESITIQNLNSGIYAYYVYNFSKEAPLAFSKAKVTVYKGSSVFQEFIVSPSAPTTAVRWNVFTLDLSQNTLKFVNTYQ